MGRDLIAARPERLLVRASTGAPGWASVPWLAFFAPQVTRSMRHGLYVVIFINPRDEAVTLSLQHGAADALAHLGAVEGRAHLRQLATGTRTRAGRDHGFSEGPICLGSPAALPLGYEAGSALSRSWGAGDRELARLPQALEQMLDLYRKVVGALE